jgi:hypothetical protein
MRWKQRYKCKSCNYVFQNKTRTKNIENSKLWKEYSLWKQTYQQLSDKYLKTKKTIQSKLDSYEIKEKIILPWRVVILVDTTYFWDFWIMAFKDSRSWNILKAKIVVSEKVEDYKKWIEELEKEWWTIDAIVCDWKKGLLWWFSHIPTQMCNFHQSKIITKYLTKKPKLEANIKLRYLSKVLTNTDKESFTYWLNEWYEKYKDFLKERTYSENWKWQYTHRKTRSAYNSLKNNLKYLFIRYDYIWTVKIPNTTNWLEWYFGHLKNKVSLHRWLKKERKIKLILFLLNSKK